MRSLIIVCLVFLSGCSIAQVVNLPGKDNAIPTAPITHPDKPGTVRYPIVSEGSESYKKSRAYNRMFEACGESTKYTILSEGPDGKYYVYKFKCN